jgi:hypothetical protein
MGAQVFQARRALAYGQQHGGGGGNIGHGFRFPTRVARSMAGWRQSRKELGNDRP